MEIEKPQKGEYVLSVNIDQGPSRILAVQVLEPWGEYYNSFWKLKFSKSNTFLNRYFIYTEFLGFSVFVGSRWNYDDYVGGHKTEI